MWRLRFVIACFLLVHNFLLGLEGQSIGRVRERVLLNDQWRFFKYPDADLADTLIYDVRPPLVDRNDAKDADSKPTEAIKVNTRRTVLKPWILPTANTFISDTNKHYVRPAGNPGQDFPLVRADFDDSGWEIVDLPHDWAIKGPFMAGWDAEVGGGMGRLPCNGVGWYRKKIWIDKADSFCRIILEIDGAMSYAMVWVNGSLAGGWPYGYASWQIDITPYVKFGAENQLAIRLDNPNHSARWYPGGGIYRNVWLTRVHPIHIAQWGTFVKTIAANKQEALLTIESTLENQTSQPVYVKLIHEIYPWNTKGQYLGKPLVKYAGSSFVIPVGRYAMAIDSLVVKNPRLWGPPPTQQPNLYVVKTLVMLDNKIVDTYITRFGIRTLAFIPDRGIFVNGEHIPIRGVNQHHDLGALGAAFNYRAAERQLEILREMGCNAIRMAHNPPAPELLELTDRMGFLVIDEIFDCWQRKKTPHDFHLIFDDWYEADIRAFIRRDRNCPSVILWSFGNEVGEQYTGAEGAVIAGKLKNIIREEDPTRPTTTAMNYAKPNMELPRIPDVIGLNYQGEGIRQDPDFEGTDRIRTPPQYQAFHQQFPDKVILSTETASALSTRGTFLFPVTPKNSSHIREGMGGDEKNMYVSAYELYAVDFGSSPDKVFAALDAHPFVAGEFVWTGWDYLGEPTPYYLARSSYSGIIDLAGFKKDRFYLYQSRWRPDFPMVHILPHWNWPERVGQITPVHVFTSGDEVELFLNGQSLGKKRKGAYEYRLRWDSVKYQPGVLYAVAYKNGQKWAEQTMETTGQPTQLLAQADRDTIHPDGYDLAFITIRIADAQGRTVPDANNKVQIKVDPPGMLVATDNGNPADMTSFASAERKAFNGLCLAIVRYDRKSRQPFNVSIAAEGLQNTRVTIYPSTVVVSR
ncbi:MAG TPA: beta-galactosidase GalB [Bacteroidales bacterium]|nr:beta-galactosidase GalB [Bacteroidales bacterium]HPO64470.1 beta-galactosidase GalB [Bacteroidales bacterium]